MDSSLELTDREKTMLGVILESVSTNSPIVSTRYDEDADIWITNVDEDPLVFSLQLLATTVAETLYHALERRTPSNTFGIGWVWNPDRTSGVLQVENSATRLLRNLLNIALQRTVMRVSNLTQDQTAQAIQEDQEVRLLVRKITNAL